MALTTFGAVMGFAAEMAGKDEETYNTLIPKATDPGVKDVLEVLSEEQKKNYSLMVKTRRENVTEMILEPVTGLRPEDYEIDLKVPGPAEDASILKAALRIEEREKRFFEDASSRIPLPEVGRIFRRVAKKKEENLKKLQGLGLSQTLGDRR